LLRKVVNRETDRQTDRQTTLRKTEHTERERAKFLKHTKPGLLGLLTAERVRALFDANFNSHFVSILSVHYQLLDVASVN